MRSLHRFGLFFICLCPTKILKGPVSSHVTFLCMYTGFLPFSTLIGVIKHDLTLGTLNLLANVAREAGRVVGLPQDCHHLALHKFPAAVAGRAMEPLEVQGAEVVTVPQKEAALSHVAATNCTTQRDTGSKRNQLNNKHFHITCGSLRGQREGRSL